MKKETLRISSEGNSENLLLYSIVTSETDLQICMHLNEYLGIALTLDEEILVERKSGSIHFNKYLYENDELIEKYILFSNVSRGEHLFPELKKNDFLLYISTESVTSNIEERINQLRKLPQISGIFKIEPFKIKSLRKVKI